MAQTLPPSEIIIIDDGSSDGSFARAQSWAQRDARVCCSSRANQGAHFTLNEAIEKASGKYISILNSDDLYASERLALCCDALEKDPELSAVGSGLAFIDGAGKVKKNPWYQKALEFYRQVDDLSLGLINGNFLMTTSNLVVRRELFSEIGLFANLRYAHDLDFFLRLVSCDKKLLRLEQPLLHYRIHDSNTISEDGLKVKAEWAAVVAYYLYFSSESFDASYLLRLAEITDRHKLTRLLAFFYLQFKRMQKDDVRPDSYLDDEDFTAFLAKVVR